MTIKDAKTLVTRGNIKLRCRTRVYHSGLTSYFYYNEDIEVDDFDADCHVGIINEQYDGSYNVYDNSSVKMLNCKTLAEAENRILDSVSVEVDESSDEPILNDVTVEFTNVNGNAFNLLGIVRRAMKEAGYAYHVEKFTEEATSGDYDDLLQTCMRWVHVI